MRIVHTATENIEIESNIHAKDITMNFMELHAFYEVYYLEEGERKYFIDNSLYQVRAGDVVIVPPEVLHRSLGDGDGVYTRKLLLLPTEKIEKEIFEGFAETAKRGVLKVPQRQRKFFENLLDKIEYEFKNKSKNKYGDFLVRTYVNELLVFLIRLDKEDEFVISGFETDRIITKAARYISRNYEKPLTLDDVAKYVNITPEYLCRLFKKKTEIGFQDYLTGVRLTEALKLLKNTNMSVTEIALRCGYSDSSYFAAVFKKFKGTTPGKYRKMSE